MMSLKRPRSAILVTNAKSNLPIPRWRPQSNEARGCFGDLIMSQLSWPTFSGMNFLACFQQGWLHCLPQFRYQKGFPRLHRIYSWSVQFSSVAQSCPTLCNPMDCSMPGLPPSPTSGAYSHSCPLSWWCHPTISSSVIPFSSCLMLRLLFKARRSSSRKERECRAAV